MPARAGGSVLREVIRQAPESLTDNPLHVALSHLREHQREDQAGGCLRVVAGDHRPPRNSQVSDRSRPTPGPQRMPPKRTVAFAPRS